MESALGPRIVAIGNALMDIFAFAAPELPSSFGFKPYSVSHLEGGLEPILRSIEGATMEAGGGAANMARASSLLGLDSLFVGTVGDDELGRRYCLDLAAAGTATSLSISSSPTGVYLVLIHPDDRRTILVAPGAAPQVAKERMDFPRRAGDILYIDGFALASGSLLEEEGERAKSAHMVVAIDLGSTHLVESRREYLLEAIPRYCDFVFANEHEFGVLVEDSLEGGCKRLADVPCTFVVKRAERGAAHCRGGLRIESPVRAQKPFDATGAGDSFAAGFLAGYVHGFTPERCLRFGNRLAEEVLGVPGLAFDAKKIRLVKAAAGF